MGCLPVGLLCTGLEVIGFELIGSGVLCIEWPGIELGCGLELLLHKML